MNKRQRKKMAKKKLELWRKDTYEVFPLKIPLQWDFTKTHTHELRGYSLPLQFVLSKCTYFTV